MAKLDFSCFTKNPLYLLFLNYDTEGADEDELLQVPQKEGSVSTATGRYLGFDQTEIGLANIMEQLDTRMVKGG